MELSGKKFKTMDIKGEVWLPIAGYEGLYAVSNFGRVKALARIGYHPRCGERQIKEKLLFGSIEPKGYVVVELRKDGYSKAFKVHRLVAQAFLLPPADGRNQVNHKDCVKTNNHADNLEWCNNSENQLHAFENGLNSIRHGIETFMSKLSNEQVIEIRQLAQQGLKQQEIGRRFGVHHSTIGRIVHRKTWYHL